MALRLQVFSSQKGREKPEGSGRQKGKKNRETLDVEKMLLDMGCNPLEGMARIALGDVVKLGYMTEAELEEEAVIEVVNGKVRVVRPSGMERALNYVPPMLRAKMYAELSRYFAPQRAAVTHSNADGSNLAMQAVQFYLPDNGRSK